MSKKFMNRKEAAEHLGVSLNVLRRFALSGVSGGPPLVRIGRRIVRYQRQQLDEWLRQRGAQPALFEAE